MTLFVAEELVTGLPPFAQYVAPHAPGTVAPTANPVESKAKKLLVMVPPNLNCAPSVADWVEILFVNVRLGVVVEV